MAKHEAQRWGRIAVVVTVGITGAVLFAQAVAQADSTMSLVIALLVGMAMEAQRARVRPSVAMSMINVAVLAAVVLAGSWAAVIVASGGAIGAWRTYPTAFAARTQRAAFNFGMYVIAALAAGTIFAPLASHGSGQSYLPMIGPLLAAAILFSVVNFLLLATIVWVSSGERPNSLAQSLGPMLVMQPAFVAYALVAVALIDLHPFALALLAVPVLMSRASYGAFEQLTDATESLLRTLISLIEQRDGYTKGHAERVAELAVMLGRDLGYSHTDLQTVRHAALLHDIGKICVPLQVIRKPGRLTREEFDAIKLHPTIGARVLEDVDALRPALAGIRHHHERIDGTGYPDGLAGDQIPELVRVVSIADAFDAMTSTRSYRKAMPVGEALTRLVEAGGSQLDADLVARFLRVVDREGWEPTVAPADSWPADGEIEPVDNCCAPTLSEQFGAVVNPPSDRVARRTAS